MGVTPFGMSIIDMPAETSAYPEHDHSSEGPGNPPAHQLGQEEVYIALRGSADVQVDGQRYELDAEHIIRVGPTAQRGRSCCLVLPAFGFLRSAHFPGRAYDPASTVSIQTRMASTLVRTLGGERARDETAPTLLQSRQPGHAILAAASVRGRAEAEPADR